MYKFLINWDDHTIGKEVELDEKSEVTKAYIKNKVIEEVTVTTMADSVIDRITKSIMAGVDQRIGQNGGNGKGPRIDLVEAEADKTKSWSDWCRTAAVLANADAAQEAKSVAHDRMVKAYSSKRADWSDLTWTDGAGQKAASNYEASGVAGGYTAPPEYTGELFRLAMERTILADKTAQRPMANNMMYYYKLDQTGTVTANQITGYLGGAYLQWAGEQGTGNQVGIKLKQASVKANKLQGYAPVPIELLQDSHASFDTMLTEIFSKAVAYYLDLAFLVGDGVDKPLGVKNSPCAITFNRAGGAGTATLAYDDLANLENQILEDENDKAFWIFHTKAKRVLYTMADTTGRLVLQPYYPGTTGGPASVKMPMTILGRPFYFTEKLPTFGTAGDVMLVNPTGYLRGDRMAIEIAASPHAAFTNFEMTYRIVCRVAGQPFLDKAFTLLDGTSQLSTFAYLS